MASAFLNTITGSNLSGTNTGDSPVMTATVGGIVPTPPNNTTMFLRGDATFAVPTAAASAEALTGTTFAIGITGAPGLLSAAGGSFTSNAFSAKPVLTSVEKDLGTNWVNSGTFDITGLSGLTTNAPVLIMQANGPYTNKGTLDDDSQMDVIAVTAYALNGTTVRANWNAPTGPVSGNFKFIYTTQLF